MEELQVLLSVKVSVYLPFQPLNLSILVNVFDNLIIALIFISVMDVEYLLIVLVLLLWSFCDKVSLLCSNGCLELTEVIFILHKQKNFQI